MIGHSVENPDEHVISPFIIKNKDSELNRLNPLNVFLVSLQAPRLCLYVIFTKTILCTEREACCLSFLVYKLLSLLVMVFYYHCFHMCSRNPGQLNKTMHAA